MTTAETFGNLPAGTTPADQLANPSQSERGVLYSDYVLPRYTGSVAASRVVDLAPIPQDEYGVAYPQIVHMDDETGTSFKVFRFMASKPRTDVWVVKDTALGTQPEGLNTDVARKLMSMGFNVLV